MSVVHVRAIHSRSIGGSSDAKKFFGHSKAQHHGERRQQESEDGEHLHELAKTLWITEQLIGQKEDDEVGAALQSPSQRCVPIRGCAKN